MSMAVKGKNKFESHCKEGIGFSYISYISYIMIGLSYISYKHLLFSSNKTATDLIQNREITTILWKEKILFKFIHAVTSGNRSFI